MITDTIVSMTELRTKTKSVMMKVKKYGSAIVVSNNKPLFVITFPSTWDEWQKWNNSKWKMMDSAYQDGLNSQKTYKTAKEFMADLFDE